MSVMNGFRAELINKIVGFNSHVVVNSYGKISGLKFNREFDKLVHSYVETNYGEAVLIKDNFTKGLSIRGYKPEEIKNLPIFKNDKNIDNKLLGKTIVIGKELSFDLNLKIGDKILLMSPSGEDTIIGNLPKQEIFEISSFYESGLIDFDRSVAFMNINNLETLLNLDEDQRNLEIYLINPTEITNA